MATQVNPQSIPLNENHRRSIAISLQLLDKQLCQWEEWLQGHVSRGVMYQQQNRLSAREQTEPSRHIEELRQWMIRLRDDLQLSSTKPRTAPIIVGQATVLWEMLAELNSNSLQGYGAVPQELANYLDPIGKKLAAQMQEVSMMFSRTDARDEKRD